MRLIMSLEKKNERRRKLFYFDSANRFRHHTKLKGNIWIDNTNRVEGRKFSATETKA